MSEPGELRRVVEALLADAEEADRRLTRTGLAGVKSKQAALERRAEVEAALTRAVRIEGLARSVAAKIDRWGRGGRRDTLDIGPEYRALRNLFVVDQG